jgi:hypothetical protein
MAPIKTLKGCGRKQFKEGVCGNYQGLLFMKHGKQEKLFFRSSEERESYYNTHLRGDKQYSKFMRYSVCSTTTPAQTQRRCGSSAKRTKSTTRKTKRKVSV